MSALFDQVAGAESVEADVLPAIIEQLAKSTPFCLWLRGDLGAGKTTFAGKLLHGLGLAKRVPVLSPTFTYLTEYKLPQGLVAHIDLYRMADHDEDSVASLLADRKYAGMIVEWPERCPKAEEIKPTAILDISFTPNDQRRYVLNTTDSI